MRLIGAASILAILLMGAPAGAAPPSAEEILRQSGVSGGLCVHLGVTDGRLEEALGAGGRFLVHGLAADAAVADKAREYLRAKGVYGRISVEAGPIARLPYAENTVNLLVADDSPALAPRGFSTAEALRVLVPGGVLMTGNGAGTWTKVVKPRPAALDEWTHWRHGPDGNTVSDDTVVDVPARLQWASDPTWARSHVAQSGPRAMVTAGGRFFCVYDLAPRGLAGPMQLKLAARDAFNGVLLWERDVESDGAFDFLDTDKKFGSYYWYQRRSVVASSDRVYAVLKQKGPLVALDAADGRTVKTYDKAGSPREVVFVNGRLVLVVYREKADRYGFGTLCCVDAGTGDLLWIDDKDTARYPVVAGDRVFFDASAEIACVALADGKELWRAKKPDGAKVLCFYSDGRLILKGAGGCLYALSAADGSLLWSYDYRDFNGPSYTDTDVYASGGLVWVQRGSEPWAMVGLDPATGREARRIDFPKDYAKTRGHHRCHPNKATSRFFLLDTHGIDFIDRATGRIVDLRTFRGACYTGILPADGLLFVPPNACQCGEYLRGFVALAPRGTTPEPAAAELSLERGSAYGAEAPASAPAADEWPTYRHDGRRSGGTSAAVAAKLDPLWDRNLGGKLTGVTVAQGLAFVALSDAHELRALDAVTGEPRWSYTAGGRIDGPPTIWRGLALFGARDGWLYCLRAKDGQLAWRLRAAPEERRIVAFGQLESAWPLNGSVLVQDGVAFVAAGRSSELDGGIYAAAVDAAIGKVLWRTRTSACLDETLAGKVYEGYPPVSLNDVLIAGDGLVSMRTTGFDAKTGEVKLRKYVWWPRAGMLDANSWAGRMEWRGPFLSADMLVFDSKSTYGFATKGNTEWPVIPGRGQYQLFAKTSWEDTQWAQKMPLRAVAMVLAADALLVAGTPDAPGEKDYWAAFEGREGAEIRTLSAADGRELSRIHLDAAPEFDGMAAAHGRLYVSTRDGRLRCYGQK